MSSGLPGRLARNVRQLREARGLTQQQMAKLSSIPRATWGHLESGSANPTLAVLDKLATALQVPIEELTAAPRSSGRLFPKAALSVRRQGDGLVRKLLPDPIPGMLIDRMEIPPRGRIPGVPHMPGTREYLTCEAGAIVLAAGRRAVAPRPGRRRGLQGRPAALVHDPRRPQCGRLLGGGAGPRVVTLVTGAIHGAAPP